MPPPTVDRAERDLRVGGAVEADLEGDRRAGAEEL